MEAAGATIKPPITNDGALVLVQKLQLQHLARMQTQRALESHGSRVAWLKTVSRHVRRWEESAATVVRGQPVFPNSTLSKMTCTSQAARRTLMVQPIGTPGGSGQEVTAGILSSTVVKTLGGGVMEAAGATIKPPITNDGALVLACQLQLQHLARMQP